MLCHKCFANPSCVLKWIASVARLHIVAMREQVTVKSHVSVVLSKLWLFPALMIMDLTFKTLSSLYDDREQ